VSLPQAFIDSLQDIPGLDEPNELFDSLSQEVPVSIRINPEKTNRPIDLSNQVKWNQYGYYLDSRPFFTADPWFHAGAYYVQEASSMVVGTVVSKLIEQHFLDEPILALDLCAAPGGKSTDIISQLRQGDLLLSNEVVQSRTQVLKENVIKWGYPNHLVSNNDPRDFQALPGLFQIVVVDAPCSGEGMFRKDEVARTEWSPEHVDFCGARQERIVSDIWESIAEGGFLIYSTCTFNRRENERVLAHLSTQHDPREINLTELGLNTDQVINRFFPHQTRGEGFSFFIVQKTGSTRTKAIKERVKRVRFDEFRLDRDGEYVAHQDYVLFQTHPDISNLFQKHLRLLKSGVQLGTYKKKKFIPSIELSLSISNQNFYPDLELSLDQAQAFLRCETFFIEAPQRGIYQVTFEGIPLGYINHLGNRFNNNYPTNWRIRTNKELIYQSIF
jgi:16S rRNA (cytosine1407-C5)-methyltransferase